MNRVLIVDDASFMRASLRRLLEEGGFEVIGEAENGLDAIGKYKSLGPDLVTMDITMPELDGIQAIRMIRALDSNARIVVISAMGQEGKVREAVVAGAKGFIIKPFKADRVIEALSKL